MNNIDTAAIVATVGTIAALVVIALFLRGCGKGKEPDRIVHGDANDTRWARTALECEVITARVESLRMADEWANVAGYLYPDLEEQCAQRIARDETESQEKKEDRSNE